VPPGPRPAPIKQGLGLGLGLGPKQRAGFSAAAKQGQGSQWLANRPGIQGRIQGINPTSGQANRLQQFMGSGQSQRANMPRPPVGQPQRGSGAWLQRPRGQTQPLGASVPGYGGVNPGMQSVLDSRLGQAGVPPQPDWSRIAQYPAQQGWSGDNASMQGQLGAQTGGYAIGSGEQGPSFGPGGPYGGGGQPQPMSGYGGNAYGAQMGGQFGSFGGGGGPRDFGQSSYAGPVQQQRGPQAGYGGSGFGPFGGAVGGPTGYGGGSGAGIPGVNQSMGGFGSFGGGGGPRDFGQSSYAGPVQQQRPGGMYGGSLYNQGANYGATQYR
jgi:hypothetical protein